MFHKYSDPFDLIYCNSMVTVEEQYLKDVMEIFSSTLKSSFTNSVRLLRDGDLYYICFNLDPCTLEMLTFDYIFPVTGGNFKVDFCNNDGTFSVLTEYRRTYI